MFTGISTYIPGCWCVGAAFSNTGVEAHTIWIAFSKEDKDVKPGVCKQCISADLTFTFSDSEMRWQGLCNSCGTITLA